MKGNGVVQSIFVSQGYKPLVNDLGEKIPIYPNTKVELKGTFRSTGKNLSCLYFGLHCYKKDGTEILSEQVLRVNEPLLITSLSSDSKSFTVHETPKNWFMKKETQAYQRVLGFYYDGNTNRLPDYTTARGSYESICDKSIELVSPLPKEVTEKIEIYKTVVMNHFAGGTYDYSVCPGSYVPKEWTTYQKDYFGESFEQNIGKFRPETKYIKPFMLINYNQSDDEILEMKDFEFNVKYVPKFF